MTQFYLLFFLGCFYSSKFCSHETRVNNYINICILLIFFFVILTNNEQHSNMKITFLRFYFILEVNHTRRYTNIKLTKGREKKLHNITYRCKKNSQDLI